jgi:hypothetical protein
MASRAGNTATSTEVIPAGHAESSANRMLRGLKGALLARRLPTAAGAVR